MRIGLLSDTHIPDHAKELPAQLKETFRDVDLILHAGDIYTIAVLDELECLAPVLAAEGDDDYEPVGDRRVKEKQILTIEGVTIWLTHEKPLVYASRFREKQILTTEGIWLMDERPWSSPDDSKEDPQDEATPDILIFGHTHKASLENIGSVLLVNPGSATFPYYKRELGTVALLTVNSGKAEISIVQLY